MSFPLPQAAALQPIRDEEKLKGGVNVSEGGCAFAVGAEAAGMGRGEGWWHCLVLVLPVGVGFPSEGFLLLYHAVLSGVMGGGKAVPGRGCVAQHTIRKKKK